MKKSITIYMSITGIAVGFILIGIIGFTESIILLVFGIIILLVSIISMMFFTTLDLFRRDKILDIEKLKNDGYTIVKCKNCDKDNVKEDKYCIFCGEKLDDQNEQV